MNDKIDFEGLTYGDVLLLPAYSEVLPRDVSIRSRFSRNIQLNTPIVSAAMDTVTEYEMAITLAHEGGIGVLHKNMTTDRQVAQVKKVKRAESIIIKDPVSHGPNESLLKAGSTMKEKQISGILVVEHEKLLGIITHRDIRFEKNLNSRIKDVMTPVERLITANENIKISEAEQLLKAHKIEKLPVTDASGKVMGLITFRDITKTENHPLSNKDKYGRLRVAAAIGITKDAYHRAEKLIDAGVDALVIDTAHAHSLGVKNTLTDLKKKFPDTDIVVGNIATESAAKFLAQAGADAVKVGIGPGSICTTRIVAGIGVPQLSSIYNVSKGLKDFPDIPIIADGGIRYSGDIPKALAAGADSVMLGSLLAGSKESPGETIIYEGRKYKVYRGMGSVEAMDEGSKDRYFQDMEDNVKKLVPEGIVGRVPFKGDVSESLHQLIGGLKAGMGYCGSKDIPSLKKAKFVRLTSSGIMESHPHNITITKDAPNYSP